MFKNMGRKIKMLAQIICWIGIVFSAIIGILAIVIALSGTLIAKEISVLVIIGGVLYVIIGSLLAWIGSFLLYGYGQLIENSDILVKEKEAIEK